MKVYEISFFKEFACMMGDCPNTCCKGWKIVFDDETYHRYLDEPGQNGRHLRSALKKTGDEVYFKNPLRECIFHEKSGRCNLQQTIGEAYMPKVCRVYPRFYQHYGSFAEESLFLSCPRAAALFLEHIDDLNYVKSARQADYERWGTNEDEAYLSALIQIRQQCLGLLHNPSYRLEQCMRILLDQMKSLQQSCLDGETAEDLPDCMQMHNLRADDVNDFKIPVKTLDQMLTSGFYHTKLKKASPLLYELLRYYFKLFDQLTLAQADARYRELCLQVHRDMPKLDHILRGYLCYYLQMVFLEVYEDYSFIKKMALGIAHTQMLELFIALHYEKMKHLSREELILLISVYDRRGRHNEDVAEGMYARVYPIL